MSTATLSRVTLSHLDWLESEAIHIMREVAGQCSNPVLLFSGGKDSICMLRIAEKAFRPGRFPFPLLHIDTGHNYPEVTDFRDRRAAELGERLIVRSVEDSMARGTVVLKSADEPRNKHQSVTLLEAIEEFGFDACIGGARRDEEKARAKERIFSFRDEFGQWDPKNQRPELWDLYNARSFKGENIRVFPISNWTEIDVWQYIEREGLALPSIYFAHRRPVVRRKRRPAAGDASDAGPAGERSRRCGALPHRRRHHLHGAGRIGCRQRRQDHRRDGHHDDHRARRDPPRRPDVGRLDGTTQEGRLFLMSAIENSRRSRVPDNGLLRFLTCGSVDDGKSTLIGRLLFDSKTILADTLHAIERTSEKRGWSIVDLSLLTDGLQAEREQGITIDVAYRYFTTGTRKYIIADAPGHEQYTRNMVTAASTADLAIILIDARKGVLTQTRRHSYLAHLLGIPHLVVAVNKMDLVDYSQETFERIKADYLAFAGKLGITDVRFIPMSALNGDMIVDRGERLDWYDGPTLLEILEAAPAVHSEHTEKFRFPVQYVCRPQDSANPELHDYRGFMGRVESGELPSATR
jgi:sulfate adenylyltransferase small subunit